MLALVASANAFVPQPALSPIARTGSSAVEMKVNGLVGDCAPLDNFDPLFNGKLSSNPLLAITQVPKLGLIQIFVFIGFMEVMGILNSRRADYEPGNFLGTSQWETTETWDNYQLRELNNGRLAMFASVGMLTHAYITGKGPLELLDAGAGGIVF